MSENRVLKTILGTKDDEVPGELRLFLNEKLVRTSFG
jgi:hypothetical protein